MGGDKVRFSLDRPFTLPVTFSREKYRYREDSYLPYMGEGREGKGVATLYD